MLSEVYNDYCALNREGRRAETGVRERRSNLDVEVAPVLV